MWALEGPLTPSEPQSRLGLPVLPCLVLGAGMVACAALVAAGSASWVALRVAVLVVLHGALFFAALSRAASAGRPAWSPRGPALVAFGLLASSMTAAMLDRRGALAYGAVLGWLALLAGRGRLAPLGVRRPSSLGATLPGLACGTALGAHLLLSAPLTLGYRLRTDGAGAYLAAVAYDLGVNVPSGELFFRGVFFDHLQRRASFAVAASAATTGYVLRYLVDPQLPRTVETITGAVLYLSLLSLANCWLFWKSGSVLPGAVGALAFFAAYRALGVG